MYPTVPAERYFAGSPALPAAQACQHDDAAALRQAVTQQHISPDAVGTQGMSLLLLAMANRSLDAVRELLQLGANPNLRTRLGENYVDTQPVALAAGGDNTPLLKLLLTYKGDPNSRYAGEPAILFAANTDRYDHMRLLLDHGANINATDEEGHTLLLRLARRNQFDKVVELIKRGADVYKTDNAGGTVAFEVQDTELMLTDSMKRWGQEAKQLLKAQGVKFPVPHPGIAYQARVRRENAQRRQWQAADAGGHAWLARLQAAAQPSAQPGLLLDYRQQAEHAFQAWRKAQPHWTPPAPMGAVPLYPFPVPTAEQDQADSVRYARPAQ